jgi:hypothetical protein
MPWRYRIELLLLFGGACWLHRALLHAILAPSDHASAKDGTDETTCMPGCSESHKIWRAATNRHQAMGVACCTAPGMHTQPYKVACTYSQIIGSLLQLEGSVPLNLLVLSSLHTCESV